MCDAAEIVGHQIVHLLQTPSRPVGVWVEEFGEAYWIELVAELDDGRLIDVHEYDWSWYKGERATLQPAELVQEAYTLGDVEGHKIVGVGDTLSFGLALDNRLSLCCLSGPGGNYPWLSTFDD